MILFVCLCSCVVRYFRIFTIAYGYVVGCYFCVWVCGENKTYLDKLKRFISIHRLAHPSISSGSVKQLACMQSNKKSLLSVGCRHSTSVKIQYDLPASKGCARLMDGFGWSFIETQLCSPLLTLEDATVVNGHVLWSSLGLNTALSLTEYLEFVLMDI